MKSRLFLLVSFLTIVVMVVSPAMPVGSASGAVKHAMPANYEKIEAALVDQGIISASDSEAEKKAAVTEYLQKKMMYGAEDKENPMGRKQLDNNEKALTEIASKGEGKQLGRTISVLPSNPQFKAVEGSDKLLLLLVEFGGNGTDYDGKVGPMHNEIPTPDNSFDLWVPNFDTKHYQDMLFTPGGWTIPDGTPYYAGEHRGSMYDYYLEQSYGTYTVTGGAYGWYKVDKPEAYYGDDNPDGGHDNLLPGTVENLIEDLAVAVDAAGGIDWEAYDNEAVFDWPYTDNENNRDCIIDHPMLIHAGIDQSGGGGAQGDDAIWAHSSSVLVPMAATPHCPDGIFIYNYTIMPEDGGVGVFAHEFGHDLGLPDEYDTIYSGAGDSVGFWSLMSSGSWTGRPAQTQPPSISIWGRYALGWVTDNLLVTNLDAIKAAGNTGVRLEQVERWGGEGTYNAVRINLPPKEYTVNTPYSGTMEWFGGKGDEIDTTITRTVDLTGKTTAGLDFWTWYDIEEYWDFGFVQVSEDGGATWVSLPIEGTTTAHDPSAYPTIEPNLPGFTGNSGGWLHKTHDLSAYAGKVIQLRFRYITDWGTSMAGWYLDDISVTADGAAVFMDGAETEDPAWTVDGWDRNPGGGVKPQYYMLEWRNLNKMETDMGDYSMVSFDNGLTNVYQFDPFGSTGNPNEPWWFSYTPGMLMWYRDMTFTDNWTGAHPGGGFLLVVDSHPNPIMRPSNPTTHEVLPWSSRVQSYDATFSPYRPATMKLGYYGKVKRYVGNNAMPSFEDFRSYWSDKAPAASVKTPTYGLNIRILGVAKDFSAALLKLSVRK